ncbi:hypothetical protein TWF970_000730 [Orbilia oligospora]|uniref:H-type lectin domain-containing protein n=1 Tax=Orbilia oligospora TaxID=2813651 RepID=A0A7C8VYG2_ORBOL|nr:hypothetical protein TWF970_000730 [Orbilia oligospora]
MAGSFYLAYALANKLKDSGPGWPTMPKEDVIGKAIDSLMQEMGPRGTYVKLDDASEIEKIQPTSETWKSGKAASDFSNYEESLKQLTSVYNETQGVIQKIKGRLGQGVNSESQLLELEALFEELIICYNRMVSHVDAMLGLTSLVPETWHSQESKLEEKAVGWIKSVKYTQVQHDEDIRAVCAAIYPFLACRAEALEHLEILHEGGSRSESNNWAMSPIANLYPHLTAVKNSLLPVVINARSVARDLYGRLDRPINQIVGALENSIDPVNTEIASFLVPGYFKEDQKIISGIKGDFTVAMGEVPSAQGNASIDTISKQLPLKVKDALKDTVQLGALTLIDSSVLDKLRVSISIDDAGLFTLSRSSGTYAGKAASSFMLLQNTSGVLHESITGKVTAKSVFVPLKQTYNLDNYSTLLFIVKLVQNEIHTTPTNPESLNIDFQLTSENGIAGVKVVTKNTILEEYTAQYILVPNIPPAVTGVPPGTPRCGGTVSFDFYEAEKARGLYIRFQPGFDKNRNRPRVIAGFSKIDISGAANRSINLVVGNVDCDGFVLYVSTEENITLGVVRAYWLAVDTQVI